jgi:hypothetical protein
MSSTDWWFEINTKGPSPGAFFLPFTVSLHMGNILDTSQLCQVRIVCVIILLRSAGRVMSHTRNVRGKKTVIKITPVSQTNKDLRKSISVLIFRFPVIL